MFVKQIQIKSLGNSSYLVGSEETRTCAVVDPVRDVDLYLKEAEALGVRIVCSLETHVHNDYISGSRELAAQTGAQVCAPGAGGLVYANRQLRPGDSIDVGEARLQVIPTPGHTPEHIAFLLTDLSRDSTPRALFSGGALLVGGVARSDLLGKDVAPFLGKWLYRTIRQELHPLDDGVVVYPTHGGGSFCLTTPSGSSATTTTIGQERTANPFFQAETVDEFLALALGDLPSYPRYYSRMANINVRGPRILGGLPALYPLSPQEVWTHIQRDSVAIDLRPPHEYAAAHIPRSYSVPYGASAGTWVGWLVEEGRPLVIICDEPSAREDVVRQLVRIGYDTLDGYLEGSMIAWQGARLPVARLQMVTAGELHAQMDAGKGPLALDVRSRYEWKLGHVPNAVHVELGQLPEGVGALPRGRSYATLCAAGIRACTAASILEREGFGQVELVTGGTNAWREAGYPLEKPEVRGAAD